MRKNGEEWQGSIYSVQQITGVIYSASIFQSVLDKGRNWLVWSDVRDTNRSPKHLQKDKKLIKTIK